MGNDWLSVAVPLLMLGPVAMAHWAAYRLLPGRSVLGSFLVAFATVWAAFAAVSALLTWGEVFTWNAFGRWAADLIILAGISYAYADAVSFGQSSIRTRILDEIDRAGGELTSESLLQRYGGADVFALRLERLTANGQIDVDGGRARTGPNRNRQLLMGRLFLWLRRLTFGSEELPDRERRRSYLSDSSSPRQE
jgi:hypothetical protein